MEPHQSQTDGTLALSRVDRTFHFLRRPTDEIFQHVIQEAEHILEETLIVLPFEEAFGVH